jgi:hypothetical protein
VPEVPEVPGVPGVPGVPVAPGVSWRLSGRVLVACNCDWGCPCNFNARPTTGKCEGGWTWHVDDGSYGDVGLNGLNFSVYVKWPGAIHEGNGEALILIDERADSPQRAAIQELLGGKIGGPWQVLAWTWPTVHGPYSASYELAFDGVRTRMKCGEYVDVECGPIRNPVNAAESYPSITLPQGIIFSRGDLGTTTRFRVGHSIEYDHSGQYMALGTFEYKSSA